MGAQGRRSHNPIPPEVPAQARPPATTPLGARQNGTRNVRCTDFGGASVDHGGLDPCGSPSLILFFPSPTYTHTHTHTHTHTTHTRTNTHRPYVYRHRRFEQEVEEARLQRALIGSLYTGLMPSSSLCAKRGGRAWRILQGIFTLSWGGGQTRPGPLHSHPQTHRGRQRQPRASRSLPP